MQIQATFPATETSPNEFYRSLPFHGHDDRPRIVPMTVGIGAICEGGKAAVIAADRMITYGDYPNANFRLDADYIKVEPLTPRAAFVYSGNNVDQDAMMALIGKIADADVAFIAEQFKTARAIVRQERIEDHVRRATGAGMDIFRNSLHLMPPAGNPVSGFVINFKMSGQMLLVGTDRLGAHVYTLDDSSLSRHDDAGFSTVGSGWHSASIILARRPYKKSVSIAEAVCAVFEAKRLSESVYGVGSNTDVAVLRQGHNLAFLSDDAVTELEDICQRRTKLTRIDNQAIKRLLPA